jgi:hypothetical protein
MADWLPPRAPGGQPPPRFDTVPERPSAEPEPAPAPYEPPRPPQGDRPVFVPAKPGSRPNALAIAGLVLGITGLALLLLSLGLGFVFALPCSIAAWLCSSRARARINAGDEVSGAGQAKAGYWLGVAGVALGVAAMVIWIALIASGFDIEEFRDDLERELEQQRNREAREARLIELRAAATALLGR